VDVCAHWKSLARKVLKLRPLVNLVDKNEDEEEEKVPVYR
jgi:hypothetical protein